MLAKKDKIPYRYPVSRNQYPVSLPNESQTSLYGDEAVKSKNIIYQIYTLCLPETQKAIRLQNGGLEFE
jgi:hypothetical protein